MKGTGRLIVAGTPIGNLADLTPRTAEGLRSVKVWLAEDTRVSGRLAAHLGIKPAFRTVNEHTPEPKLVALADELAEGLVAALVTDAGTPGLSDPGARLVDLCRDRGVDVDGLPGISAVTTALMLSGFFAQRFAFLGFLPRKPGPMREELAPFRESPYTLVAFESCHRLEKLLDAAHETLGPRRYALCRELTKLHEQVWRGTLPQAPTVEEVPRRGELTIVFEGLRRKTLEEVR